MLLGVTPPYIMNCGDMCAKCRKTASDNNSTENSEKIVKL